MSLGQAGEAALPRVIIVDDDVLLREGLTSLLSRAGFDVAAQASDAEQLLELIRMRAPDLLIIDIRMPPTHTREGLDAAKEVRAAFPEIGNHGAVFICGGGARHRPLDQSWISSGRPQMQVSANRRKRNKVKGLRYEVLPNGSGQRPTIRLSGHC
ncbi:response regulator [Mycetocola sp. CAN_C7]|uniref:response regulator n=1 Tax=Mycetocola sp. CAN_C7 TaxID=2787724 RepID=UPI0018CAA742